MFKSALLLVAIPASAIANPKSVGTTKDACDGHAAVTFATRDGTAKVTNDQKDHRFAMTGFLRELHWYCGGTRERVANDAPFNVVVIHRAANGAIAWTFQNDNAVPAPHVGVGNSEDACDKSHIVTVRDGQGNNVEIRAGEVKTVDLAHPTQVLSWQCGASHETVRNHADFDHVQIERAANGALQWVFFHDPATHTSDTGAFIGDARGVVRIAGLPGPDEVPDGQEPNLAQQLATNFEAVRPALQKQIDDDLKQHADTLFPGVKVKSIEVTLPGAANLELRVVRDETVRIKLVAHDVSALFSGSSGAISGTFKVVLDLDVVWTLPRSADASKLKVQATDVVAHHVDITGDNVGSGLWVTLAKPTIREIGNSLTGHSLNGDLSSKDVKTLADFIDVPLAVLTKQAPPGATATLDVDEAGDILACVKLGASNPCKFRTNPAAVTARKKLDTSKDQCGERTLWMWDAEQGQFVKLGKGESRRVHVESARFEWYCGSDAAPDAANQEWAAGPLATRIVEVTRKPSGREIDWQFLFWK